MTPFYTRTAAAVLLVGSAMSAQAVTLSLPGWQFGGNSVNITSTGTAPSTYSGPAGGFAGSLSGAGAFDSPSFVTYCVELEQSFAFGSLSGYSLVSPATYTASHPNGWGPNAVAVGNRLGSLLTYALPVTTNAAGSTSLQLAIWNTIYDTDNTVGSGTFTDVSAFATQANTYLTNSLATVSKLQIGVLTNERGQDFIAYAPVPEPDTYALMAAGLAALGFMVRRRTLQD